MLSRQTFILVACLFSGCSSAYAQVFGGNPASLKWRQINTDTARIIFPEGLSAQAIRVADILHYLNAHERKSIGNREAKLDLVLQNQTITSNGYVALAPFRSEFQITPSQESFQLGSESWTDFLTIHEYRHALQNMNFNKGASHVMRILFGEAGQSLATGMAVPNWFWEGDAVFMETALSRQGRGRLPAFYDQFRALQLEHKHYSWLKIRNGSLKDQVPDHYHLGYLLCAYGREKFGDTLWKKVTGDAVRFKGLLYPFSHALKKYTGMKMIPFYQAMLEYYTAHWTADTPQDTRYQVKDITRAIPHTYIDRSYPAFISDDSLLYLQYSYKKIPAIFLMDSTGKVQPLVKQDIVLENYFSYNAHKIAWIGYRSDPRWGWKDFGVLRIYDMDQRKLYTLSHNTKYFSPDISHDGKQIIVAEATEAQQYSLVLLRATDGQVIRHLQNPAHFYYTYPKFAPDDQSVFAAVRNDGGEMAIVQQWLDKDSIKVWTPFCSKVVGIPVVNNGYIFFAAAFGKTDNLYAVKMSNDSLFQVTDEKYGSYQPTADPSGRKLVFSGFSLYGHQLKQISLDPSDFKAIAPHMLYPVDNFYAGKALQDEGHNILDSIPHTDRDIIKYPKTAHLVNVHSWEPIINDPNYGFQLLSDNILNTLSASLYYQYNRNEFSHTTGLNAVYGGLYPMLSIGGGYVFDRSKVLEGGQRIYWNEAVLSAGAAVPWNFSANKYYRYLTIGGSLHNSSIYYRQDTVDISNKRYLLQDFSLRYFDGSMRFIQQRMKAQQNIYSHFAQDIYAQYIRTIGNRYAEKWLLKGDFYFPGFFPNHNIVLQAAYQQTDTLRQYTFSDNFIYARGYSVPYNISVYKLGINYHFPVCYPDIGIGGIVYAQRIRGNVFYDYSRTGFYDKTFWKHQQFRSAGVEMYFDTRWWNEYPLTLGIRFSRLLDQDPQDPVKKNVWELIIPLQFF